MGSVVVGHQGQGMIKISLKFEESCNRINVL